MLIGPFRLTALAEWKTIYILKRVVEGQNYDYDTIVITKFAAIWNKVYNGWVQEFPLAKGFAEARFHLSYALFSSFDDDESFVIGWCILFHWWGSLPADVLWGSFVTLLGSILLRDSAYHVLTWDKAQFERFSYILPNGYRWNWTWYKLLLEVLIEKGSATVSCELRIGQRQFVKQLNIWIVFY